LRVHLEEGVFNEIPASFLSHFHILNPGNFQVQIK
jgi:hypothetical protein